MTEPVGLTRRPLRDRISYIADQLEASITDLRGLPGVSRARVVLAASVATLREVADQVLEQGVELDELRLDNAALLDKNRRLKAQREAAATRQRGKGGHIAADIPADEMGPFPKALTRPAMKASKRQPEHEDGEQR